MNARIPRISFQLSDILFWGFIFRVILIPFFSDDYNFWAARVFTNFWVNGFNPWSIVCNDQTLFWINPWRYPPLYIGFVAPAQVLGSMFSNEIVFLFFLKVPLVLADIVTVFFIYRIVILLRASEREAVWFALFYAFNPVTVFISSVWGTMDPIPVMFTVMAVYYFLGVQSKSKRTTSAILLGLGIAFKLYPVFILPAFLAKIRRFKEITIYTAITLLPIALFSIPFLLWDGRAYAAVLLFHNVGGLHPLFPVFYPESSALTQIVFFSLVAVLFAVAYLRNNPLIANITLSFFALYIALGGNLSTYSLWMVPFATLLLSDSEVRKIKSLWLLPFFPMVSIIYALIYNGPFNAVEGVTGVYYWIYHWARQRVVVFKSGLFVDYQIFMAFASILLVLNMVIIMYFFIRTARCKHSLGAPNVSTERHSSVSRPVCNKNSLLVVVAVIVLLLYALVTSSVVPFEPAKAMPQVRSGAFVFYDDFNSSLLNYQWAFVGDGKYTLDYDSVPSHISFNGAGAAYNQTAIFRGWGPFWHGFYDSGSATVSSRFRFESLNTGSTGLILIRTDGGYLEVEKNEFETVFNYFDDVENRSKKIAPVDDAWHEFSVTYTSIGRFVSFDNWSARLRAKSRFSYLYVGSTESARSLTGSFSIDWIEVVVGDFPTKGQNVIFSILAIVVPILILLLIAIKLVFSNRSASPSSMKDKSCLSWLKP